MFPIIFQSFICGIHPNFVPCFVSPLSAPCHHCMPCLHLIVLRPLYLGLNSSPSSIQEFHSCHTSNPAADDMQIALPPLADATRVHCLNSHNSDVTQEAHLTYVAVWVCHHHLFLCTPPPTNGNQANEPPFHPCSLRFVCSLPSCCPSPSQIVSRLVNVPQMLTLPHPSML